HRLFAELLQLELRRAEPALIHELHSAAAGWFTQHGHPVEAIRHAQAAQDWDRAARLLSDQWLGLYLDGQAATAHELLRGFPADVAADAELTPLRAADELKRGSLEEAERLLSLCEAGEASGANLRARARISLGTAELWAARLEDAQGHLEQGAALARRFRQPYLEVNGRAHLALVTHFRSFPLSAKQSRQVIELAWRHGWTDD